MSSSAKPKKPKSKSTAQALKARYSEVGALATARAGVRHVLRRVLDRLEMKDYGYTTGSMLVVTDRTSEEPRHAIAPPSSAPVQSQTFAARAQAAQKRGDWHNAGLFWQKELSQRALPYVGLSEAAAAQGDIARAEAEPDRVYRRAKSLEGKS